ncbi:indolepyruvate oxidoreductase subunit beta family protein [Novosphingobium naphthalenivorans]|uniref:indolepyruvate oxidoreductase subunit beta family protein n=1 Tax=Novosphingobium naphthalenivorans TaxID=273168 RepID=UPI000A066768|nr:indolepyruvate oxidoreductase subunit beta family protein [Novosphingobium naphthalenivorans]
MNDMPKSKALVPTDHGRIGIAILALGGQGGGVLADWIQHVARAKGWLAQGTSVPGVAQRTGSTVYYVELGKMDGDRMPVMAQMPVPGDVDIVIASELMEAGRAMLRGFSTADRTTLIGSTHRVYAISEKMAMGDGRGNSDKIVEAAGRRAKRFVGFDMEAATYRSGSVISAVMFGALAGSGALPFARADFEEAIEASDIAVPSNMRGFDEGYRAAQGSVEMPTETEHPLPIPTTIAGRALQDRVGQCLPEAVWTHALHGVERLTDYQDAAYAGVYLDRLVALAALDAAPWELTNEVARHLALWMSYEDTIRVADLKTRASRLARVRSEVGAADGQLLSVTEFMHPRLQEICDTLPALIGRSILKSRSLSRFLDRFFQKGRYINTTSLHGYLMLRTIAAFRRIRRKSLRFHEESERIEDWLRITADLARRERRLALEWVRCQRLIKGYSSTFEHGLRSYTAIRASFLALPASSQSAEWLQRARDAALGGEGGHELEIFLKLAS